MKRLYWSILILLMLVLPVSGWGFGWGGGGGSPTASLTTSGKVKATVVNVRDKGALANMQTFTDGVVSGTAFTSATASFNPSQSGYGISIWGAGALLTAPASLSALSYGTSGSTHYWYAVTALTATGETTAGTLHYANGYATLSSTNYNILTWYNVPYATGYNIYKSTDGTNYQLIFSNWQPPANASVRNLSINDTGLTGNAASLPSANTAYGVWQGTGVYVNSTTMTLSTTPTHNVSGATFEIYADDTAAINSALSTAATSLGTVLVPAGTYTITGTLVQFSNTKLQLDPHATIRYAPGATGTTMLVNNAYANPVNSNRTSVGISLGSSTVTLNTASSADVGKSIAIPNAGPGYTPGTLYATVIACPSATTLTIDQTAFATVSGGTAIISQRDSNIEVTGGLWDKGGVGGSTLNNPSLMFNKVDGLYLHDLATNGFYASRPVSGSDVTNVKIERTYIVSRGGGIQFGGPLKKMSVRSPRGKTGDDFVAFTAYDYANTIPSYGNMTDIFVDDVQPSQGTTGNAVLLNAGNGTKLRNVSISKVKGYALRGVFANEDGASANTTGSNIGGIVIDDINVIADPYHAPVHLQSLYGQDVTIRNMVDTTPYPNGGYASVLQDATSNFQTIKLDNLQRPDDGVTNWNSLVKTYGTIGSLIVNAPSMKFSGSNVSDCILIAGGTVTNVMISNGLFTQAVAANSGSFLHLSGNATVGQYYIEGLIQSYGYNAVRIESGVTAPKGFMSGVRMTGSYDFMYTKASTDLTMTNSRIDSPYYHGFNVQNNSTLKLRGTGNFFDAVSTSRNIYVIESGSAVKTIGVDYQFVPTGATAARPSASGLNDAGTQFRDTTLGTNGMMIYYNGTTWTDLTGTAR